MTNTKIITLKTQYLLYSSWPIGGKNILLEVIKIHSLLFNPTNLFKYSKFITVMHKITPMNSYE